jgi:hypothetical protein
MSELVKSNYEMMLPKNFDELARFSKMLSSSDLAPKDYKGKPENVAVAIMYGYEIGLQPMQAVQNIAVINGRPCVWGDAMLAVIQGRKDCEDITETLENGVATCMIQRAGKSSVTRDFSIEDAKKAGLWGKQGPWTQYPNRMLQMRARAFAIRDAYADVLRGVQIREEVEDYPKKEKDITKKAKVVEKNETVQERPASEAEAVDAVDVPAALTEEQEERLSNFIELIKAAANAKDLQAIFADAWKFAKDLPEAAKTALQQVKDARKSELKI